MSKATLTVNFELDGYTASLALDGDSGAALLRSWPQVKAELGKLGAVPVATTNGGDGGNGPEPRPHPRLSDGTPDPAWCPVHGVAMRRREKHGDVWYSHQVDNGTYCRGANQHTSGPQ